MRKRTIFLFCCFCLIFSLLYMRIAFIMTYPQYVQAGQKQGSYTLKAATTRGQIYDCNLNPLVDKTEQYLAAIMPCPENINDITHNLDIQSKKNIQSLIESGKPFLANASNSSVSIPFVDIFPTTNRYTNNQLAQHIIGYIDGENKGVVGIEKSFNDVLNKNSQTTTISYKIDGLGRQLMGNKPIKNVAPKLTDGVVLTLDSSIQKICEEAGKKYLKKGAIVVMDPYSGKIKASCSFPSYDVATLSSSINDSKNKPLINRAFLSYNVGSTFKIVTMAQALSQGISTNTSYYCDGDIDVSGQVFKCHKQGGHGYLNMKTAMQVSCNPYFINLALKLDKQQFINTAHDLSFGKPTIFADSLSSSAGYLPTLEDLYNPADVGNFGFGQGVLMATPIQISQMLCAVVNSGDVPTPSLVEGFTNNGIDIIDKPRIAAPLKAMSSETASTIKEFLISCVMDTPAQYAKPSLATAGGKTATAQTGVMIDDKELLQAWFCGFYPADKPKYVITVLAEDGLSGNQSASPVFREIVDKLY